jgi:selenocysteine-specific elongation factor
MFKGGRIVVISQIMQPVIIGTAGHIDHGKTALIKALTGEDTDRLKEEKERGITIELGYAFLNDAIAFIDVPGHERFIKNMVAGATTVDFALLVVAADDGVMPQTREHLDILNLLRIESGVVAITKCDLADEEWVDLVEADIRDLVQGSFLEGKPILRVDGISGRGIESLREALIAMAGTKRAEVGGSIFRMPVDRVFSIKGFGTVVTGSVLSGRVSVDGRLEILPSRLSVRVRGIESHGAVVSEARAGMRAALNLTQVGTTDIARGDVVATPARLVPTYMLDGSLSILKSSPLAIKQRERVRLHIGTKELLARVMVLDGDELMPGETGLVQLRLEEKTAVQRLDRFVVRRYSPPITIGGGEILDANPTKHRKRHASHVISALREIEVSDTGDLLVALLSKAGWLTTVDLVTQSALTEAQVEEEVSALQEAGRVFSIESKGKQLLVSRETFEQFETEMISTLELHHEENPLKMGFRKGEIRSRLKKSLPDPVFDKFLKLAEEAGVINVHEEGIISLHGFEVKLSQKERTAMRALEDALHKGGLRPPDRRQLMSALGLEESIARSLLQFLVDQGIAVNLDGNIYFHSDWVADARAKLEEMFSKTKEVSMSDFRARLDTSRKYAMPLLNHFDNIGVTRRIGDMRQKGPKLA